MEKSIVAKPKPGFIYTLPISDHEWAALLILGKGSGPRLQGRVATRVWSEIPVMEEMEPSLFQNAYLTFMHGPLGIRSGEWKHIGNAPWITGNDCAQLAMYERNMDKVTILDGGTLEPISRRDLLDDNERNLPIYGVAGHVYIQGWLGLNLHKYL